MLKVVPAGPFPSYDSNLSRVESPYLMCGPATDLCYAAGCIATDTLQQVHHVVALDKAARKEALRNQAALALMDMIPEADRWRVLMLQVTMLSQLVAGTSLPTNWQGINWQTLYTTQGNLLKNAVQPVTIRYSELLKRVEAGAIQDGEMSAGWPSRAP
jgi:hypothetical protein